MILFTSGFIVGVGLTWACFPLWQAYRTYRTWHRLEKMLKQMFELPK